MRALADAHVLIGPGTVPEVIRASAVVPRTLVALGRTVVVEGRVHGDVVVVGADLYMHPGGHVDGRALAIGGAVYESMLAYAPDVRSYRDFTFDIARAEGGYILTYRILTPPVAVHTFSLPGIAGLQMPSYDRSNGLSVPLAASIAVPGTALVVDPRVTYRSQLGRLDPSVSASALLTKGFTSRLEVGRGTFTNDAWIWSDLINSAEYALLGDDARNYFRATRVGVTVSRVLESATSMLQPYLSARWERATSVRPQPIVGGGPWALMNRRDHDDVLRANPPIDPGSIASVLGGVEWSGSGQGVIARARLDEEVGRLSPEATAPGGPPGVARSGGSFAQTTLDGAIEFPTFGSHRFRVLGHGVASGGTAPRQRWAYVGGPGSLPTLDLLERGGDRLVYVDARYDIPLTQLVLPAIGSPTVTLREALAGAATAGFPTLAQATGVRLSASLVYVELLVDPVTRKFFKGAGFSVVR